MAFNPIQAIVQAGNIANNVTGNVTGMLNAGGNLVGGDAGKRLTGLAGKLQKGLAGPLKLLNKLNGVTASFEQGIIEAVQSRKDPLQSFQWIAFIDNGMGETIKPIMIDKIQTSGQRYDTKPVYRQGQMNHYASSYSTDNITISLYTDTTGQAITYCTNWFEAVRHPSGYFRLPAKYKRNVRVVMVDSVHNTVATFTFQGCWPTAYESYSLDAGGTIIETTMQLSVDSVRVNESDAPSLSGNFNPQSLVNSAVNAAQQRISSLF